MSNLPSLFLNMVCAGIALSCGAVFAQDLQTGPIAYPTYPGNESLGGLSGLPAIGTAHLQDSDGQDPDGSLAERLKAIEDELKKKKEADEKKKADDALKPSVKPRGRLHTDLNYFSQSALNRATVGDIQDGAYFRRARLGFDAKAFEYTEYRLDFEMTSGGGRPSIFDAYGKFTELPFLGNLMIGHFREPFSLEAQTSSNWFTFIERGLNNTFDPSRNWGIMVFNQNACQTLNWATGIFREGSDNFGDDIGDSGEWAATSRLTWLAFYDEACEGRHFLALGTSYSYRDPDNRFIPAPGGAEQSIVRYQGRPEDNLNEDGVGSVPAFISVSIPDAVDVQLLGFEATRNFGSLNIQSEYICSTVDRGAAGADVFFHGAYFQVSYFLTGECRQWDRAAGTFGRAKVNRPWRIVDESLGPCPGYGAWEIAARWNYLDLSDEDISGGYMDATTLGLNWYLSSYVRMMFDYEYLDLHDPSAARSSCNVFHARLDVHF